MSRRPNIFITLKVCICILLVSHVWFGCSNESVTTSKVSVLGEVTVPNAVHVPQVTTSKVSVSGEVTVPNEVHVPQGKMNLDSDLISDLASTFDVPESAFQGNTELDAVVIGALLNPFDVPGSATEFEAKIMSPEYQTASEPEKAKWRRGRGKAAQKKVIQLEAPADIRDSAGSDSLHTNLDGVDLTSVPIYLKKISESFNSSKSSRGKPPQCISKSMKIGETEYTKGKLLGDGSSTQVYEYDEVKGSGRLAVKFLLPKASENSRNGLLREKVFLSLFSNFPKFAKIYSDWKSSKECINRVLITSVEGDTELGKIRKTLNIGPFVVQAIQLIQTVHERGFVHGDVHRGQFLLTDGVIDSLRLIDFGRTEPYLTAKGTHVPEIKTKNYGVRWNAILLSVFELEDFPKTRRDDFFRLVEMFLHLLPGDENKAFVNKLQAEKEKGDKTSQRAAINVLKKNRRITHPLLGQLYTYALGLRHDERPDYESWIRAFS